MAFTTHLHLVKTLKKEQRYTSTRNIWLHDMFYGEINLFTFILDLKLFICLLSTKRNSQEWRRVTEYYFKFCIIAAISRKITTIFVFKVQSFDAFCGSADSSTWATADTSASFNWMDSSSVMCPVCRILQHPANRTHNPQLYTGPATWKPQHEIPQAATTV